MSVSVSSNRKERRAWAKMVRDAREVSAEIVLDEETGESISVGIPDADAINAVYTKRNEGDLFGALAVLLGDDNTQRLRDEAKKIAGEDGRVPITVWRDLMDTVMADLGLAGDPER